MSICYIFCTSWVVWGMELYKEIGNTWKWLVLNWWHGSAFGGTGKEGSYGLNLEGKVHRENEVWTLFFNRQANWSSEKLRKLPIIIQLGSVTGFESMLLSFQSPYSFHIPMFLVWNSEKSDHKRKPVLKESRSRVHTLLFQASSDIPENQY